MKYANEEMTHAQLHGSVCLGGHRATGDTTSSITARPVSPGRGARGSVLALGVLTLVLGAGSVLAKLPPPTPEEQAAAAQKAEIAAAQLEKEKQALERVQDQLAARYGAGNRQPTPETEKKDLPKAVKEAPGDTGPKGGTKPSAEAHSAPVK